MSTDIFPVFSAMLRGALADLIVPDAHGFVEMLAADATMEFPYAPAQGTSSVHGREAIAAYLAEVGAMIRIDAIGEPTIHRTHEPGVVILEFTGTGAILATGRPYSQHYISVITTIDGHIAHYRDYWNPLALGGAE